MKFFRLKSLFYATICICLCALSVEASPKSLKQGTLVKLESLADSSGKKVRKVIEEAQEEIEKSLSDKDGDLFIDEVQIVSLPRGKKVFDHESHAAKELQELLEERKVKRSKRAVIKEVLADLVEADRQIVWNAIHNAEMLAGVGKGDSKKIRDALKEYRKALNEKDTEKAIKKFEKAWEKAQDVTKGGKNISISSFEDAPDPFSPGTESNVLTATFQIALDKKGKGKDAKQGSLDFVQVIKDSSGTVIRTIQTSYPVNISGKKKDKFFEINASSTWDGTDEQGVIVESGTYTYLAYGELIPVKSKDKGKKGKGKKGKGKKSKDKLEGVSFPVTGTIEVNRGNPLSVIEIRSPDNLSFFADPSLNVSGTAAEDVVSVEVNGIPASLGSGEWSVDIQLKEGGNAIVAVATDAEGNVGTASIQVSLDTTPPNVVITSPSDGFVTSSDTISVSGIVNDIVAGTVNAEQATVTVNGVPATVSNRCFLVGDIPLAPGLNTITAVGVDRGGNSDSQSITVTRQEFVGEPFLELSSGNNQEASVTAVLPDPIIVTLDDGTGNPPPAGTDVIFRVLSNNGKVDNGNTQARSVITQTDAGGKAQALWTLGSRAGAGNNLVQATAVGFEGTAVFSAFASPGTAGQLHLDNGNGQVGPVNEVLPNPFAVVVTDDGFNRLPDVPVTFQVEEGGGSFNGQPSIIVNTDSDGRALASLVLGPDEGIENNIVSVDFPGNASGARNFVASGVVPGDPEATSITGVVLDNTDIPVPGVTIHIKDTDITTQTDELGQFELTGVPVGHLLLEADGVTATRPGTWPHLEFEMVTVAGRENTIGMPIFMLPLDPNSTLFVDETNGGTLRLNEVPGFALEVPPGTVTFPDGSKSGTVSVTLVHFDKIPMVPNFGQQPAFVVTIQPAGAIFDPPASLTIPNVDGLAPGEVTEMYSFDHDLGSFVAIGTGTVSEDGTVIASDPGIGVLKAGWHCGGNPEEVAQGITATVNLDETEIVICKGEEAVVTATGSPTPEDTPTSFEWQNGGADITSDRLSGTTSKATIKGTTAGEYTAKVRYRCKSAQWSDFKEIKVTVVEIEKLLEADFQGNVIKLVKNDGTNYAVPDWLESRTIQSPIGYVRNEKARVTAKFQVKPSSYTGKIKVKGVGPNGIEFPEKEVTVSGGIAVYPATESNLAFPDSITLYNKFQIEWRLGVENTDCASFMNENQLYVTLNNPQGTKFHTLFHIGCLNANGERDPDTIVTKIYSEFTDLSVQRVNPATGNFDGTDMTYWSPTNPAPEPQCWTTAGLLEIGDGRCGAWASFFVDILRIQGINSSIAVVDAPSTTLVTKLNNDVVTYLPPPTGSYRATPIFYVKDWDLSSPNPFNPVDQNGVAGQGNGDPRSFFCNHAIVKYNGKYYDPSYGSSAPVDKIPWEDAALDGYGAIIQDSLNGFLWIERFDPKGSQDTSINP